MSDLHATPGASPVWRIGRHPDAWAWPDWAYAEADGTFGNRFDDPDARYRVLYACSERVGCFLETLARFRPDPAVIAGLAEIESEEGEPRTGPPGRVPADWLEQRCIGEAGLPGLYCELGASATLAHLRVALATELVRFRLEDLDAGDIRARAPRRFTQAVSRYVFEVGQHNGICYQSRLGDELTNWAIFEPHEPAVLRHADDIRGDDPDFLAAVQQHHLELVAA